jgi:hypothetical protein
MKFDIPRAELEAAWLQAAQPIAETPGLRWKVWLMNEAEREAGASTCSTAKRRLNRISMARL